MRVLATALFAGLLAVGASASEIAPGAVVHGDAVFLTSADGLAAAHGAATGVRRWSSPDASRPLAAHGTRVLAQAAAAAGQLRLVFLDAASGRRVGDADVDLPPGVSAPLDDNGEIQFRVRVDQDGPRVRLDWTWEFRPMRGAHEEDVDDSRRAEGAVLVDMATGRVTPAAASAPAAGPQRLPAALAGEAEEGAFRERPLRVGPLFVATQADPAGVVLKRWTDNAVALPDVALPPDVTLQLGSADGRHVLVSREIEGEPFAQAHEWTVVALDTGARVATLRAPTAAAAFAVAGDRVVSVQQAWEYRGQAGWQRDPRRVAAFDRASGAPAWTHEIRDTSYRGPVAP
jgi:hypothetical protein